MNPSRISSKRVFSRVLHGLAPSKLGKTVTLSRPLARSNSIRLMGRHCAVGDFHHCAAKSWTDFDVFPAPTSQTTLGNLEQRVSGVSSIRVEPKR
jgi:hypothetical protein